MVFPNPNYPGQSISEKKWNIDDVEKEFRAQIELALKLLPGVSHISGHMGCTFLNDDVKHLSDKLAREYGISNESDKYPVLFGFGPTAKTAEERIEVFIEILSKLENGKTYIFLDHPGINNDELKAVYHIGYENVSEDRQAVTDVFTSEKVKSYIKEKGIQLISYKNLD